MRLVIGMKNSKNKKALKLKKVSGHFSLQKNFLLKNRRLNCDDVIFKKIMVGTTRLELTTSSTPRKRSSQTELRPERLIYYHNKKFIAS